MDWSDISINKHAQIMKVMERDYDENDMIYAMIGACYGMTLEQVLNTDWRKVEEMAKELSFLNKKPKVRLPKSHYDINGTRYNVKLNLTDITTAQYIDFQMLAGGCEEHMAQFLSIILIPDGHKYNQGYNMEFVQNEIGNYFSVEDAVSLSAFFFTLLKISLKRTTRQFLKEKKKAVREGKMTQEQMEVMGKVEKMLLTLQDASTQFML